MKFYTRDYLDHKELVRCSTASRAIWPCLICLMNEGHPYGYLRDKLGHLSAKYIGGRISFSESQVVQSIKDLSKHTVLGYDEMGYFSPKMVADEKVRSSRAAGGVKSQGNPNVPRVKDILSSIGKGYPLLAADKDGAYIASSSSEVEFVFDENFEKLWQAYPAKGRTHRPDAEMSFGASMLPLTNDGRRELFRKMIDPLLPGGKWLVSDNWAKGFVCGIGIYIQNQRYNETPEPAKQDHQRTQYKQTGNAPMGPEGDAK